MAKLYHASRRPTYFIFGVSIVIAIIYTSIRYLYSPQHSQIMAITPSALNYGQTTIVGLLQKDSPTGIQGNYVVILPDMRAVTLDIQDIDSLLMNEVIVSGVLTPDPLFMQVSSITTAN